MIACDENDRKSICILFLSYSPFFVVQRDLALFNVRTLSVTDQIVVVVVVVPAVLVVLILLPCIGIVSILSILSIRSDRLC